MYETRGKPCRQTRSGSDSTEKIKIWGKKRGFFVLFLKKNPVCLPAGPRRDRDPQNAGGLGRTPHRPRPPPRRAALSHAWVGRAGRSRYATAGEEGCSATPGRTEGTGPGTRGAVLPPPPPHRTGLTLSDPPGRARREAGRPRERCQRSRGGGNKAQ